MSCSILSPETQVFSTIPASQLSSSLLRVSGTQDGCYSSRHYSVIQGRKKWGQGRVESSGVRENAVGTRHNQQVSPTYAGRAGGPVEVHSNFWTGDLTLLQPAAHSSGFQRITCAGVCSPRVELLFLTKCSGGWSEGPIPKVSSSSWWHSVWLPSNTGDGISGNEIVPTGGF